MDRTPLTGWVGPVARDTSEFKQTEAGWVASNWICPAANGGPCSSDVFSPGNDLSVCLALRSVVGLIFVVSMH